MSSSNMFSSKKPQRRLGRRSMAMNNTTLNGTMNGTAKHTTDFSYKLPYEPSCASTPLPDHSKNKENIFLSSIKPVLVSSPKSVRQAPYQTQKVVRRLGRRSMALRTQNIHTEEASLNDSLTRMRDINASLKLSDPKLHSESIVASSQPPSTNSNGSSFQSSMNSFLNYDFLKKFLPSSAPPLPSPTKHIPPSPLGLKPKYESVLKNATMFSCKMISEAESESPTVTDLLAQPTEGELEADEMAHGAMSSDEQDDGDFLKKSLNCGGSHKMAGESSPSAEFMESKYGSFLEDMSPPTEEKTREMECDDNVQDFKPDVSAAKPNQSEDAHNRTFEFEEQPNAQDQNLVFKTPQPPKFIKKAANESIRTPLFKTPMSSVFSRFTNNEDGNDSFVENERTIMLQFKNEMMQAKKNETPPAMSVTDGDSETCAAAPSDDTGVITIDSSNDADTMVKASSIMTSSATSASRNVTTTSKSIASHATSSVSHIASPVTDDFGNVTNHSTNTISNNTSSSFTASIPSSNVKMDALTNLPSSCNTSNLNNVTMTGYKIL
ncbi:hypothetical protein WDU94_014279 [Cyamophila willieti]